MTKKWNFNRYGGYAPRIDRTCRSNFEATIKKDLESRKVSFEYETLKIPYVSNHKYTPDFVLGNGIIVEAKGLFESDDRSKHLAIQKQHPEYDIRFIFQRDNFLRKGSKTRYSDWCKKYGFKYTIGTSIPDDWINERT